MALNPGGFQITQDNGFPDTFTGRAITAISGGQILAIGSQAATVGSMAVSFAGPADVWLQASASGIDFAAGIALTNTPVASGGNVAMLRKGDVILPAAGNVAPGDKLGYDVAGGDAVSAIGSADNPIIVLRRYMGYALTGASSGGFVLTHVNL